MAKNPTTTTAPTGSIAPFGLRMLPELKDKIEESAKQSGRSMNAEIVERLTRTYQGDDAINLMRGNVVLLRALADFVVLRHAHPEVMRTMEDAMVKMARAVKDTDDDAKLLLAATPSFREYARQMAESVNKVTEILGSGWAKDLVSESPKP